MISGANYREGVALSPDGAVYVTLAAGGAFERVLFQWGVPFIAISGGTMGNNGAMSALTTAIPTQYTDGAYVLLPAGAIAAGVPAAAAWYWCTFSSTSAGTVWNSTYTSGVPRPGTQTAFATTGPGAFVGVTAETTGPSLTIPGNSMGANGRIVYDFTGAVTNNANSKTLKVKHGVNVVYTTTAASVNFLGDEGWIQNSLTNRQVSGNVQAIAADTVGSIYYSLDTTADQTLSWTFTKATATDNLVLLAGQVKVAYQA